MSRPVTFFRPREAAGELEELDLNAPNGHYRLFLYSRKKLDLKRISRELPAGALLRVMGEIREKIAGEGEGGVLVAIDDGAEQRRAAVFPLVASAEAAFGTFGVAPPGASMYVEPANGNWQQLPPGSHLFVPVDRPAEESLRRFQEDLAGLSRDLESLVLYAIRKPSLDTRVANLEAKAADRKDDREKSRWSDFLLPFFIAVLALIVGVNILLLYSLSLRIEGLSSHPSLSTDGAGREPKIPNEGEITEPENLSSSLTESEQIAKLLEAVERHQTSNKAFEALHTGPFALGKETETEIASLLANTSSVRPLVIGLLKLEALRLRIAPRDLNFGARNNLTETKKVYAKLDQTTLNADLRTRNLLAALACMAYKRPSLPQVGDVPAVDFAPGRSCNDFPLATARPGLDDLTAFVQSFAPAGGAGR
jgi:hypothetical protein